MYPIRLGRADELEHLRNIEVQAGAIFAEHGMREIAEDEPFSVEVLTSYCSDGRLWVATDENDRPVGYIIVDAFDQSAHIEQVSVDPDFAGKRIGHALIDKSIEWAIGRGYTAMTLTTFQDVPWNAPYYQRLGFEVLPERDWSDDLVRIRSEEATHGLDRWPRVCMHKALART